MKATLLTLSVGVLLSIACNNTTKENKQDAGEELTESVKAADNASINTKPSDSTELTDAPIVKFKNDTYDFSKIKEGEKITHKFEFTNTGKSPLIISDVQAGCGCTTPKFDKKPINPGAQGSIEIGFNSSGQRGTQHKIITVYSNAEPKQLMLHLKGEVVE